MTVRLAGLALAAASLASFAPIASEAEYPFAFLEPVVVVDAAQRARLRSGEPVVTVLPASDGHVAVSALVRVDAEPHALAEWARRVELQRGRYVESVGRFSQPPQVADLASLTFDDRDLEDIDSCRPTDCDVKLSASEMASLRRSGRPDRPTALRALLVRRATEYLRTGDCGIEPYADDDELVAPAVVFDGLLRRMEFLPQRFPGLAQYIRNFPSAAVPQVTDSFLYWSKETLGVKPIVGVTHVTIARFDAAPLPEVIVVAKQVFANHYKNGSLTMTAITGRGADRYLVYVQRAHIDLLQGFLGSAARHMLERRVKNEAPDVLLGLRDRLQSGELATDGSTRTEARR
jgi:hypothetical protein